jgi:hypothetical protein
MRRSLAVPLAVAGGAVVATKAYRVAAARRDGRPGRSGRRHVVTVFRPLAEVAEKLPELPADRPEPIEVRLSEAPGDRGTQIAARAADRSVPDGEIRRYLRVSRSLL